MSSDRTRFQESRIVYREGERETRRTANEQYFQKLNDCQSFVVLLKKTPLVGENGEELCGRSELNYALTIIANGDGMPYPLFEEASCTYFPRADVRGKVLSTVRLSELACWLERNFGDQFRGIFAPLSDESVGDRSARNRAEQVVRLEFDEDSGRFIDPRSRNIIPIITLRTGRVIVDPSLRRGDLAALCVQGKDPKLVVFSD